MTAGASLTEARLKLAEELRAALGPDIPVFGVIANQVTAPCVVLSWGAALPGAFRGLMTATIRVQVIAGGGDNEATVEVLESILLVGVEGSAVPWIG